MKMADSGHTRKRNSNPSPGCSQTQVTFPRQAGASSPESVLSAASIALFAQARLSNQPMGRNQVSPVRRHEFPAEHRDAGSRRSPNPPPKRDTPPRDAPLAPGPGSNPALGRPPLGASGAAADRSPAAE